MPVGNHEMVLALNPRLSAVMATKPSAVQKTQDLLKQSMKPGLLLGNGLILEQREAAECK